VGSRSIRLRGIPCGFGEVDVDVGWAELASPTNVQRKEMVGLADHAYKVPVGQPYSLCLQLQISPKFRNPCL
jgi:hypothetical protein